MMILHSQISSVFSRSARENIISKSLMRAQGVSVDAIMRADLERLLISEAELWELTGFNRQQILPSIALAVSQPNRQKAIALAISAIAFFGFASIVLPALRIAGMILLISLILGAVSFAIELAEVAILFFCAALAATGYSIYVFIGATLKEILLCLGLAIASGGLAFLITKWIDKKWQKPRNSYRKSGIPKVIIRLFTEADKCNKTIHDIDIFDQLQDAGNPIKLESRESAIAALRMTRNDIVRALKTERILREHPEFHPDRFEIDLTAFESIQMRDRAKEYGRIFDDTLQIAIDVQSVMYELQESI